MVGTLWRHPLSCLRLSNHCGLAFAGCCTSIGSHLFWCIARRACALGMRHKCFESLPVVGHTVFDYHGSVERISTCFFSFFSFFPFSSLFPVFLSLFFCCDSPFFVLFFRTSSQMPRLFKRFCSILAFFRLTSFDFLLFFFLWLFFCVLPFLLPFFFLRMLSRRACSFLFLFFFLLFFLL